jgi:phospholipid transport system transporter-binding protein
VSATSIQAGADGTLQVAGVLDFPTVVELCERGAALLGGRPRIRIDLQGVERANSAGLVLLLEWLAHARRGNAELEFRNLPASLASIARFTNVADLLGLE